MARGQSLRECAATLGSIFGLSHPGGDSAGRGDWDTTISPSDAAVFDLPRQPARSRQGVGLYAVESEILRDILKSAVSMSANKPFPIEHPAQACVQRAGLFPQGATPERGRLEDRVLVYKILAGETTAHEAARFDAPAALVDLYRFSASAAAKSAPGR